MLKIQRIKNGVVTFIVSGRLEAANLHELSAVLAREPTGRPLVLDLKNLLLVDGETVRFLRMCERDGIALRHCPPYIRVWIARDEEV
jgi:hypothetical protein